MKEVVFVVLAIAVAALVVVEVFLGLAGFEGNRGFICKKLFSRKKLKKPLNAKPYCAPLPPEKPKDGNLPHDIQCEVCFCGASPYCADFTDGDDGCCYWQKKEPVTQSPAGTEGIE